MKLSDIYRRKGFPIVTCILTLLSLIISIASFIFPIVYQFAALWTNDLKPWQFFTFVFEHNIEPRGVLFVHLGMNLLGLIPFGMLTEKLLGHRKTLAIFLVEWVVTIGFYLIFRSGQYGSVSGISTITYAYAIVAFVYFIKLWKIQGKNMMKQFLPYFFIVEFFGMISILNPLTLGGLGIVVHISGFMVGGIFAYANRKQLREALHNET